MFLLHLKSRAKREMGEKGCSRCGEDKNGDSRERVSDFSLEIHAIGPLDFDGARRENVLRRAGYAWTPDLRVLTNSKR